MRSLHLGGRSPGQEGSTARSVVAAAPGGRRAFVTLADQGFSSISNFAVGVAVARVAGASGLGGFSLAYSGWLVLAAVHRSLITDPMAIEGDVRSTTARDEIKRGFAAEVLLGVSGTVLFVAVGTALMALHQETFAIGILALGPWLPALVVQDYWRWVGYMSRRPGLSLTNDTVFNCAQGAAFAFIFVDHVHSVALLIACWGLGGAAGGLWGLRQYRVLPSLAGGLQLLRSRWSFSKWLAGVSITNWGAAQAYVVLAGGILGPVGLGGLRAVQTLATGPSMVLIQAGGSVGLPEASRSYDDKGWRGLTRVARVVAGAGIVSAAGCCAAVVAWGKPLLRVIYGPTFAHLKLAAILIGIGNVVTAFGIGPILVLKTTRKTRWLFHIQVITLVASLGSVAAMAYKYGVDGAAAATVVTGLVSVAGYRWYQHKAHRSVHAEEAQAAALPREAGAAGRPTEATVPETEQAVVATRGETWWNGKSNGSAHVHEKPETSKSAARGVHEGLPTLPLGGGVLHRLNDLSSSSARSSRNLGNQWFVPAGGRRRLAGRGAPARAAGERTAPRLEDYSGGDPTPAAAGGRPPRPRARRRGRVRHVVASHAERRRVGAPSTELVRGRGCP